MKNFVALQDKNPDLKQVCLNCLRLGVNLYAGEYGKVIPVLTEKEDFEVKPVQWSKGFVDDTLYICFKGSAEPADWKANFRIVQRTEHYQSKSKIRVHTGFKGQYKLVKKDVLKAITEYLFEMIEIGIEPRIVITGHSLGGALATLCAIDISINTDVKNIICIPIGSPRVGNRNFRKFFNKKLPDTVRFINHNDLICRVPTLWMGYIHIGNKVKLYPIKWTVRDFLLWPINILLGSILDHYPGKYTARFLYAFFK